MKHPTPRHMQAWTAGPNDDLYAYVFWCPACRELHPFHVNAAYTNTGTAWQFDGNMEAPTFSPSLRVLGLGKPGDTTAARTKCHLFVKAGRIQYCNDCPHELKGQTIDMVPIPEDA